MELYRTPGNTGVGHVQNVPLVSEEQELGAIFSQAAVLEALLEAVRSAGRPHMLVYTSVLFVLGNTGPVPATERAREEVGDFADAMCLDQRVAAPRAASLGWQPRWPAFSEAVTRAYTEWIDAGGES